MKALLNRTRRRVLLSLPENPQLLQHCLEAFTAGFKRGVMDVSQSTPKPEWQPLTEIISLDLVKNRSAIEAGSWLAGLQRGRFDQERHIVPSQEFRLQQHIHRCFCEEWETSSIADRTLKLSPGAVSAKELFKVLFLKAPHKKIADKLPPISTIRVKRQAY